MGIPGLWDIIGEGRVVPIADLVTEHFARTGRPLRIAIDEAGWRFNNLTDYQVKAIREKDPAANPIEKAILWRLLKLMRMNIQPIFVFDGPARPWKHGRYAGRIEWQKIDLLRQVLDGLKVPHHRAPAEAEAECARLQQLGIVDAVWSDDGDTFMFGATTLIRSFKHGKKGTTSKSDTHVVVYTAEDIEKRFGLDRPALILFALLSGGDYDSKGLEGCGSKSALDAVTWRRGHLSKLLYRIPLGDLKLPNNTFTKELQDYFLNHSSVRRLVVPSNFPRELHVKHYRDPKISSDNECTSLKGLRKGWDDTIDEGKLRTLLRTRFGFRAKEYIRHIVPILLVKHLLRSPLDPGNGNFNIRLIQKRGKTENDYKVERLVSFNPLVCSNLNLAFEPEDEDWSIWNDKNGNKWDPCEPVEIEVLNCFLEHALGPLEMQRLKDQANQPKTRKRKDVAASVSLESARDVDATSESVNKKQRTAKVDNDSVSAMEPNTKTALNRGSDARGNTGKGETSSRSTSVISPAMQEPPKFRMPSALQALGPAERKRLAEEGVNIWKSSSSIGHDPELSESAAESRDSCRILAQPITRTAKQDVVKIGSKAPTSIRREESVVKSISTPSISLEERYKVQDEQIQEFIGLLVAEYKTQDVDRLRGMQKQVNGDLRSARSRLSKVLNRDAWYTYDRAMETWGPENAHVISAEGETLRKEVYQSNIDYLTRSTLALREHTEAVASICALKLVLSGTTPSSGPFDVDSLVPDRKDLEHFQVAIKFQYEIERMMPLRYEEVERLQAWIPLPPPQVERPLADILLPAHERDSRGSALPSGVAPHGRFTSTQGSSSTIIDSQTEIIQLTTEKVTGKGKGKERLRFTQNLAESRGCVTSTKESKYFCLDDDEEEAEFQRAIRLSRQDHLRSSQPHASSSKSASFIYPPTDNNILDNHSTPIDDGESCIMPPHSAGQKDDWVEEQSSALRLLAQALDMADVTTNVYNHMSPSDRHRVAAAMKRQIKGRKTPKPFDLGVPVGSIESSFQSISASPPPSISTQASNATTIGIGVEKKDREQIAAARLRHFKTLDDPATPAALETASVRLAKTATMASDQTSTRRMSANATPSRSSFVTTKKASEIIDLTLD